ncbi:hypothetical protein HDE_07650 [Halotydeus destructor]|nr:hypothetical protein HDE_07650 [Halotydeus destructor]
MIKFVLILICLIVQIISLEPSQHLNNIDSIQLHSKEFDLPNVELYNFLGKPQIELTNGKLELPEVEQLADGRIKFGFWRTIIFRNFRVLYDVNIIGSNFFHMNVKVDKALMKVELVLRGKKSLVKDFVLQELDFNSVEVTGLGWLNSAGEEFLMMIFNSYNQEIRKAIEDEVKKEIVHGLKMFVF